MVHRAKLQVRCLRATEIGHGHHPVVASGRDAGPGETLRDPPAPGDRDGGRRCARRCERPGPDPARSRSRPRRSQRSSPAPAAPPLPFKPPEPALPAMPPLPALPPVDVPPPLPSEPPAAAAPPLPVTPPSPGTPPLPAGGDDVLPLEQPTLGRRIETPARKIQSPESMNRWPQIAYLNCRDVAVFDTQKEAPIGIAATRPRLSPPSAFAPLAPTKFGTSTSRSSNCSTAPRRTSTPSSTTSRERSWPGPSARVSMPPRPAGYSSKPASISLPQNRDQRSQS